VQGLLPLVMRSQSVGSDLKMAHHKNLIQKKRGRIAFRMLALALLMLGSVQAQADDCSTFPNGVLDGDTGATAPSQIQVDRNCTITNFPADNPLDTNFSFLTQPGQTDQRWIIIFDNVVHTGEMACNAVAGHKIWFTNGSSTSIQEGCQNYLIPVEKIDKQVVGGQTTAAIGVPFTYRLVMPVLFDPATGVVIDTAGSLNDLHGISVVDDLNATGVDLTYVSHTAVWENSGAPVPHSFNNSNGVLSFDNFPIVPAGQQIILDITVVLDDTPSNSPGTPFTNVAKWDFGRLIDGEFFEPLPGEWGIAPTLTIAGPELVFTKTGPATMNLGESGDFRLDIQNTGNGDAWDITLVDRFPNGPNGGMCETQPAIVGAQVYAADGTSAVPGKGPLVEGVDYSLSWSDAPSCELSLTMLTAQAVIGAGERLIIDYQSQLDTDTQNGSSLTNVAGVTEYFNGDNSNSDRLAYTRPVNNGSVGTPDHQDAHTVAVALSGYFYEKTVQNLTSGINPADTAAPGDTLRYTLRLRTTDTPLTDVSIYDDLGELNSAVVFETGSLTLVPGSLPPGAVNNSDAFGGTNGAGSIDISGIDLAADGEITVQFDATLAAAILDGTVVTNQADLLDSGALKIADSDDPNVNGIASPDIVGDEDPTQVTIEAEQPAALLKATTQPTASIGEYFSYQVTVPSAPHSAPLYDVRILDDLSASAADLEFVSVSKLSGSGSWTPVNTGTLTNLVIEDPANGIDIPAGEQVVIEITVVLTDTGTNVAGLSFTNTAAYTYNQLDNQQATVRPGDPGTSAAMTIAEPDLTLEKSGPLNLRLNLAGTFTLDIQNVGDAPAYNLYLTDLLPDIAEGGMCDAAPTNITAVLYESDGVTPAAGVLTAGTEYDVSFSAPDCSLTFRSLTAAASVGAGQRLIINYDALLDADTLPDTALTNVAAVTEWFSTDVATPNDNARQYVRPLTDGTVGVLDHEDAHTVVEFTPELIFEKTAVNVTTGQDPALAATPGDTLRYSLRIENVSDSPVDNFSIVDELDSLNALPAYQPGTLAVVTLPPGADDSNTDPNGGAAGNGLLDVRNLSLGGLGSTILVEFEVTLAPVIANGSYVTNQSEIFYAGFPIALSDDPAVNGQADPNVAGDEDPTRVLIESAPYFLVEKISTDLSSDPDVLVAGETLRYTITVQNTGTDNAVNVQLTDQLPVNTAYVSGSTTLNGSPVADAAGGVLPLIDGILINAPGDVSPGVLNAGVPDNIATISFDVIIDDDVADGTIISNQAFVSAPDAAVINVPSDDPDTPTANDPTLDVVGNVPLLFATKSATLQLDGTTPGVVDPADTLLYTITVYNNGNIPATLTELIDAVPTNTTYVADSTTLNGIPVGQPDAGVSPLVNGIPISSSDLTPPLPLAGEGTINPGEAATVQFELRVDDDVTPGTLITNQAVVASYELNDLLTDGDGNPATGPEPTVVVVGDVQQLAISKQVAVVGGGAAEAGSTLEYLVTVTNIGTVPAYFVEIYDDLDLPVPGQLAYVDASATLNGLPDGVSFAGSLLVADYFNTYGTLEPGQSAELRFRAVVDPNLPIGTTVTNVAEARWNDPQQTVTASVSVDLGGVPGAGALNGSLWHDADFDDTFDLNERALEGWTVELFRNDVRIVTVLTDSTGSYRIAGIVPNYLSDDRYELRFSAPGAGLNTAALGLADSDFTNGLQRIYDIIVAPGNNFLNLNLPIDPNGVVYNSVSRTPVAGAVVTLLADNSGPALPDACFDDPAQQNQVTLADGYYKFDLNFAEPACPSGGAYAIQVTPPAGNFVPGPSEIIPPSGDPVAGPFSVPACPGSANDAILGTLQFCEIQPTEFAPPTSVPAQSAGTAYFSYLSLDDTQAPGSSQIFNNHIPLDPELTGSVAITKTTPSVNVTRGQLVPYTLTVTNSIEIDLTDVSVVDRYPAGFRYVEGSARVDGAAVEPAVNGRELVWEGLTLSASGQHQVQLLLAIGPGVSEGEFVNRAQVMNGITGNAMSEEATATVRLVPDPTFDCTDVTGKVFDDNNLNGYQDEGEEGLGGVRLVTSRGLAVTSDAYGRFHITCAITPNENRGSNFVLKLDDRSLPSGYRASTREVQIKRATRGKALNFDFGASIHRVVAMDLADPVFETDSTDLRSMWQPRLGLLLEELQKAPSVLRLTYLADVEEPGLVDRRLAAMKARIGSMWAELDCCYQLVIEPEVHWRRGGPPEQSRIDGRAAE
jgi:uncharacterized repeat protein (TIGR01451 family)/fimbrial isopeptide formation D2 family protein